MTAINQQIRRLPGFRFESRTATREDILPRMDIALFIGFAASGPIGIPVALESAEQFKLIFGDNLPLVWDKEKGEMIYAFLAPTVRMFFRNGGKRCWVIRTARVKADAEKPLNRAAYNFFPLAGLACLRFDGEKMSEVVPAFGRARSKGSWSDDLQVATVTASTAVEFKSLEESGKSKILSVAAQANDPIKAGELLMLEFSDSDLALMMVADKIENDTKPFSSPFSPTNGNLDLKISSKRFVWLQDLPIKDFPDVQNVQVRMWTQQNDSNSDAVSRITFAEHQAELSFEKNENDPVTNKPQIKINLKFSDLSLSDTPAEGSLLITILENELLYKDALLCLQAERVISENSENQQIVHLICSGKFVRNTGDQPNTKPIVKRLTFEIWVKKGEKTLTKLNDLAFNAEHERFWGNLPVDDEIYSFSENKNPNSPKIPSWTQTGEFPYSPIAGNGVRDGIFIPVLPTALTGNYLDAIKRQGTKLERDGLEVFDEKLFLDEKLKNIGLNNLLTDAEFIRYLSPKPRRLWGIHSALAPETKTVASAESLPTNPSYASFSLDEATIISVPDALHRGWFLDKAEDAILSPPAPFDPPLRPEWWRFQDCREPEIKAVEKPLWENFLDCDLNIVEPPKDFEVKENKIAGGMFSLVWDYDGEADANLKFVLEESVTPEFEFPSKIYSGKKLHFEISGHGAGIFYYRVRAEIGETVSNWSEGLGIKISAAENWTAKYLDDTQTSDADKKYTTDVLLAVQRALLRMCAARGDIFAVLDLPEHFDKNEAIRLIATLKTTKGLTNATAQVEPFSADEKTALSYGAVYHPWLIVREEDFEAIRQIPSGGAICGVIAKRSSERGAWIAPANEALQNVLGLAKEIKRESFLDIQDASINLVRHEPTGFLVLDSDTLSDDFDLRQINVRRLLSLLRRLAVKHGNEYVFEPNDERFRRSVQRGFKSLLDKMFVRGAFAGITPATSYQVVVSDTVNNFQSVEQGRFIVELRVAPSLPLRFVTVRLINAGGRTSVTETV